MNDNTYLQSLANSLRFEPLVTLSTESLFTMTDEDLQRMHADLLREYTTAVEQASGFNAGIDVVQNHPALLMMHAIKRILEVREATRDLDLRLEISERRINSTLLYEIVSLLRTLQSDLSMDQRERIMGMIEKFEPKDEREADAKNEVYRMLSGDFSFKTVEE